MGLNHVQGKSCRINETSAIRQPYTSLLWWENSFERTSRSGVTPPVSRKCKARGWQLSRGIPGIRSVMFSDSASQVELLRGPDWFQVHVGPVVLRSVPFLVRALYSHRIKNEFLKTNASWALFLISLKKWQGFEHFKSLKKKKKPVTSWIYWVGF